MRNSRSRKQHWALTHELPADERSYPHVATSPTWTQRRTLHIGLDTPVCESCGGLWPCVAYERDLLALKASLAVYWTDAGYGHAATLAAAAARSNSNTAQDIAA